jgi:SAM-dependent methyltransferase
VSVPIDDRRLGSELHALAGELCALASRYPPELVTLELADVPRVLFHVSLVAARHGAGARVCDVGGGIGLFSLACASLGMRVTLIDDFADPVNAAVGPGVLDLHRSRGVNVVQRDVIDHGVDLAPRAFDAVTSFDSIEHWHHSPRRLLHSLVAALRPGGTLIVGAPNRVNLRKRVTTLWGRNEWSQFDEWYVPERFRGHVREPSVADLVRIAHDLQLDGVQVLGRNWLGLTHRSRLTRALTRAIDRPLRRRPALCSDIYVIGSRGADG